MLSTACLSLAFPLSTCYIVRSSAAAVCWREHPCALSLAVYHTFAVLCDDICREDAVSMALQRKVGKPACSERVKKDFELLSLALPRKARDASCLALLCNM